ncbi:MAG: hypothetical protein MJE77_20705 [Proteobacteria bacterium]|nr:hypothetical protein [Pseudomonadota bacterium]
MEATEDQARCPSCDIAVSGTDTGETCPYCRADTLISGYEFEARRLSALARDNPAALWLIGATGRVSRSKSGTGSRYSAPSVPAVHAFKQSSASVACLKTETSVGSVLIRDQVARELGIRDGQRVRIGGLCWTVQVEEVLPQTTQDGEEIGGLFVNEADAAHPRVVPREQLRGLQRGR